MYDNHKHICLLIWGTLLACALFLQGCASPKPWEHGTIGCMQLVNAGVRNTLERDLEREAKDGTPRRPVGTISYLMNHTRAPHVLIWVIDDDGSPLFYDPAFRKYRAVGEIQEILNVTDGPSRFPWSILPMPEEVGKEELHEMIDNRRKQQ